MPVREELNSEVENRRLMRTIKGGSKDFGIHILAIGVADERGFSLSKCSSVFCGS